MSTQYNPNFTVPEITQSAKVAIVSSTNATPIVVTTGTHGFADGDSIEIEGHATNTNANGDWKITKLSSTTFSLNGSVGNGVGGATGYCIDYAVNPLFTLPADLVDALDAASINPAIQGAANAIPWLFKRVGAYRLYDQVQFNGGAFFTTTSTTVVNDTTWTDCGIAPLAGNRYVAPDDILELSFCSSISASASSVVATTFGLAINGGSASPQAGGQDFGPGTSGVVVPITLAGNTVIPGIGTAAPYTITILGKSSSGTPNLVLSGPYSLTVRHWRKNS